MLQFRDELLARLYDAWRHHIRSRCRTASFDNLLARQGQSDCFDGRQFAGLQVIVVNAQVNVPARYERRRTATTFD
jgi:hypothetical protein